MSKNGKALVPVEIAEDAFLAELYELAEASNRDDRKARELHLFCQAHPRAWDSLGDLNQDLIANWIARIAPETSSTPHLAALKREHLERQVRDRRKDLLAEGDGPLERLLVEQILGAWLQSRCLEARYTRLLQEGCAIELAAYAQQATERANRQLARSIESLAKTRRFLRGVVSIRPRQGAIVEPTACRSTTPH